MQALYVMKIFLLLLCIPLLTGCFKAYGDLESKYSGNKVPNGTQTIKSKTFSVSSVNRRGIESFHDIASIRISDEGVALDPGVPFTSSVFIPSKDIAGCAMTCFGTDDQHIDILVPATGSDVMIKSSERLLDWCWSNRKPMYSGKEKRDWLYNDKPLPPNRNFYAQFGSREIFNKQQVRSCLGY